MECAMHIRATLTDTWEHSLDWSRLSILPQYQMCKPIKPAIYSQKYAFFQLQRAFRTQSDSNQCQLIFFQDPEHARLVWPYAYKTLASATIKDARAYGTDQIRGNLEIGETRWPLGTKWPHH